MTDSADFASEPQTSRWGLWKLMVLRGAGFPVDWILRLPNASAEAESFLAASAEEERRRDEAMLALDAALDSLRARGEWNDKSQKIPLLNGQRALKKGRIPTGDVLVEELSYSLTEAIRARDERWEELKRAMSSCLDEQSRCIADVASDDRFREAVLWQNPSAVDTAIDKLGTGARNSRRRQHEELVALYLQRYTTKNDTIGFFGPSAWVSTSPSVDTLNVRPGPQLLAERRVFFELWAVQALADALMEEPALRPWLKPVRQPHVRLVEGRLAMPGMPPMPVTREMSHLLRAAEGTRSALEIARQAAEDPDLSFQDPEQVYAELARLEAFRTLRWGLPVPAHPESLAKLREALEAVGDAELRARCKEKVDELEAARRRVERSGGDVVALRAAISDLEGLFVRLTGEPPKQQHGMTYGARTLVYEDCRRDIEVEIGPRLVDEIAAPMAVLMSAAHWMCVDYARRARISVLDALKELADDGTTEVGAAELQVALERSDAFEEAFAATSDALRERWQQLFPYDPGARRVSYASSQLRERVAELFPRSTPPWQAARHHAPDVMICAKSVEAIQRGDYQLVLGELHPALVTFKSWVFLALCPHREELFAMLDRDFSEPTLHYMPAEDETVRTSVPYLSRHARSVALPASAEVGPIGPILPIADFYICDPLGRPRARSRSEPELEVELLEAVSPLMTRHIIERGFAPWPSARHRPRITIDRLVVAREAWNVPAEEMVFADARTTLERFVGARRWMKEHDMPRHVFVKLPSEPKPFYVDFGSPILVDVLARLTRRAREITGAIAVVEEMLPRPDQQWLPDADGNRYTSELRMIFREDAPGASS